MHLALFAFVGGIIGELILTYRYGFTVYQGERINLDDASPVTVLFWAIRDWVTGAIMVERNVLTRQLHYGIGLAYLGLISLFYWLVAGRPPLYRKDFKIFGRNGTSQRAASSDHRSVPVPKINSDDLSERGIFDLEVESDLNQPSSDDYHDELRLFEMGDLDQSLWAKHLVEAEGDADKAKWQYIKARVKTAPARRAEQEKEKKEAEMRVFAEAERLKEERLAAERKAAEEAVHRRIELEIAQEEAAKEAERKASEEREAMLESIGQARVKKFEERVRAGLAAKPNGGGCLWVLFLALILLVFFVL